MTSEQLAKATEVERKIVRLKTLIARLEKASCIAIQSLSFETAAIERSDDFFESCRLYILTSTQEELDKLVKEFAEI
jgi:hypothetical protein